MPDANIGRDRVSILSLDERLRLYPELRERFEALLNVVENAEGDVLKADEAELKVIEELRLIGNDALTAWANRKHSRIEEEYNKRKDLSRKTKKNSIGILDSDKSS